MALQTLLWMLRYAVAFAAVRCPDRLRSLLRGCLCWNPSSGTLRKFWDLALQSSWGAIVAVFVDCY